MRLNHARLATLSEWKPGSSDESIHCGKQVLALVANDENRLFALPRRKVMVVDQDYFTAVRRNNLTIERIIFGVYPDFPTIFRGFSEFFVGDLMGKALWKLVENAQRFPRRGGRVLCVHGPVSFHRARPCATKWPPRRGLRTGPPASSDCGRPVNDKCSHQHRRSVQAERSSCPGKTVISGTYAIWETRI